MKNSLESGGAPRKGTYLSKGNILPDESMQRTTLVRRLPIGAEVAPTGGVEFRVWAPRSKKVSVVIEGGSSGRLSYPLEAVLDAEPHGYHSGFVREASEGTLYRFRLDDGDTLYPDPASRFQPEGPEGPSRVVDPTRFRWTDQDWRGVHLKGQILYEMHIGTYTPEGTFKAATHTFDDLARTGITLLQVMPVHEFSGRFGWGYDGVDLYAPTRLYGTPDDFRMFVDRAHAAGLGVLLDVVYNHLGPVGNYLKMYTPGYFSTRYVTEWGEALNFDGESSGPVRELIIHNAGYWISEFHLDGLRLDATQSIFDESPEHVLKDLTAHCRRLASDRSIIILAENEPQNTTLIKPGSEGGFGMDGIFNDDFHHTARVAMTGRAQAYYTDYRGTPQELISALKWGYLYQGQFYLWQKKRRGTPTFGIDPSSFVNSLQNHDQVANSPRGERCNTLTSPGRFRAMTALLLLSPSTPMLFMGQEFSASSPFTYFADHQGELGRLVQEGRKSFLQQFKSMLDDEMERELPDPADPGVFERCKLDHAERERNRESLALHRDLIALRRSDRVFSAQRSDWMYGAVLGPEAFLLRFFGEDAGDRLILVNLGRDLLLSPAPEPLLAPPPESVWEMLWSSEAPSYGGDGRIPLNTESEWVLPGHSLLVLTSSRQGGLETD